MMIAAYRPRVPTGTKGLRVAFIRWMTIAQSCFIYSSPTPEHPRALGTERYDANGEQEVSLLMSNDVAVSDNWRSYRKRAPQRRPLEKLSFLRLRHFDQLDFSILAAMKHLGVAFGIAKDKDVAIAKLAFFHRFFNGHRTQSN